MSTKKADTTKTSGKLSKVPAPASTINNNATMASTKSSKGDKRDKSQLSNNNQATESSNGTNTGNTDISPTKMHKIPQAKLQVPVGRKVESKTGLSSQQQQAKTTQQSTPVSTSIPKPMAAIKGTSKSQQQLDIDDSKKQKDEQFDVIKVEKVSISVPNSNDVIQKTQIVNPLGMSPLHNQLLNNSNNINSSNSNMQSVLMTDNLHTANNQSNTTESSNVVYRTTATNDTGTIHNDIYQMQSHTNRKLENFNDPLLINGHKFGMSKVNGCVQTIFEDDKETTSTMVPMRSLMRGFNSHMASPSRMNRYYDENGQGYCSDSDGFRKASIRYSDVENGYLSEGPHFLSILRNRPQLPSTIAEER